MAGAVSWSRAVGLELGSVYKPRAGLSSAEPGVEEVGENDESGSEIEGGLKVLVFVKDDCSENDSPDRLEVHGEVGGVSGEASQEVDIPGVRDGGAENCESEKGEPVRGSGKLELVGLDEGNGEGCHEAGPDHFVEKEGSRRVARRYQSAIEDRKEGREKGAHESDPKTAQVLGIEAASDEENTDDDNPATEEFAPAERAAFNQGFGNGGEERDGGKARQGNRDVRERDGPEKAGPMNADERSHPENGEEGAPGKAEQGALGDCEPEGHSEGRDRHSKEHQGGRFNRNDLPQDRGEREQEDEQVILEEGIQRAVRGGRCWVCILFMGCCILRFLKQSS